MDFGFTEEQLRRLLSRLAASRVFPTRRDPTLAKELGVGTNEVEALAHWGRLAGLTDRSPAGVTLSGLGRAIHGFDKDLGDLATWWVLHWELSSNYLLWHTLKSLRPGSNALKVIEETIKASAPHVSDRTVGNARLALMRALADTPLGQKLGLVQLECEGELVTGLRKLAVRHGQAPMAAVAYALLDWARREETGSAALETLAGPDGPGAVLHMSPGVLERYLVDIDGAFGGRVLSYSRTAGLSEAYFKPEVTPLQVLVSHYIYVQKPDGRPWTKALDLAKQEVGSEDATD